MVDLMEDLIKIGEEQIKILKKLQKNCKEETRVGVGVGVDGEVRTDTYNELAISNQIRDWCITIKECKDTKYENEIHAKKVENIDKAAGDLFKLIKIFTSNDKEVNPKITVNNSSNLDIDKLVKNITTKINSDCLNLIK